MDELQRQSAEVRALGNGPPTPARLEAVREALRSKFEGIQSVALGVLGRWGGRDAVDTLRAFLVAAYSREFGRSIRGVAVRELGRVVTAEDAGWVLDLYFGLKEPLEKHQLLRLVLVLPPEAARSRLVAELRGADPVNRQAAVKAIGNMAYADRHELLSPLRNDPSPLVSKRARLLTSTRN